MARLRRWGAPVCLLVGTLSAGAVAIGIEARAPTPGDAVGGSRLVTPVVSARRVPGVVAAPVAERRLQADLAAWVAAQPPDTCLAVVGADGEVAFDHRGDALLAPASSLKLLTAVAALHELGDDFRYRTVVTSTSAPTGEVLAGDLVLVGGGDPLLASPDYAARFRRQPQEFTDLDQLAAAVAATGVRRIEGAVIGDEARYDQARYVEGWPPRYIDQDQIGPLSALSVNDGFATYPLAPDAPGELEAAADPAAEAAAVLDRLLEDRGVEVVGQPRSGTMPPEAAELASLESAAMDEVVAQMLRESDNSTAELVMKELGRTIGDPSTAGGRRVALDALAEAGFDVDGVVVADGSGLSLDNRVTCDLLIDLLTTGDAAEAIDDGLPVAGRTGTLAERFAGTSIEGRLRAKTGTLNTVTSLAGAVQDADGALTFALVVNLTGTVISLELVGAQEELIRVLLSWPRVPDASVLGPRSG